MSVEVEATSEENDTPQEAFFKAAASGEVATLKALLEKRFQLDIDINGRNDQGFTALHVAVLEGYVVVVKELLVLDVHIGDALLRAVDVEFELAVKCLISHALEKTEEERDRIINCHCEGSDFHPLVTPIIRAAQKNNFPIVKLLLDAGARIPESKFEVTSNATSDSLQQSVGIVELYNAIATAAYVTQAYTDPIDKAFKLTKTLNEISMKEVEHKLIFQELSKRMESVAADLISQARNSDEILTVLKYSEKHSMQAETGDTLMPKIDRAIRFKQKKFVAEPNCQQAMLTQFCQHLIGVSQWPIVLQALFLCGIAVLYPFLSILFKLGIGGRLREFIQTPYVKFYLQLGSDVSLLILLAVKKMFTVEEWTLKILVMCLILAFALGILWKEIVTMYVTSMGKVLTSFSHIRDIFIAVLLLTESLVEALHLMEYRNDPSVDSAPFNQRPWDDFDVLSPPILAIATVVAFSRVMPYLVASDVVGPFQISLGDMIFNTAHFFVVLVAVFVAFASGITYLYHDTKEGSQDIACLYTSGDCSATRVHFDTIIHTIETLYWSLYGLTDIHILQLPPQQHSIQFAGVTLFALFHVLAILILLNALIAIMSNVYNEVEENADVEWKYARSSLWMSFMDNTFTVPPPFNILPNMRSVYRVLRRCCNRCRGGQIIKEEEEMEEYGQVAQGDYQRVINRLMERYIAIQLKDESSATSTISTMDIRDLRNDVASLRFDIIANLCRMEESIIQSKNQSEKIYGQSEEAKIIFDRTEEIDMMVDKYKTALSDVFKNVEKYRNIIPIMEDLAGMIDTVIASPATTTTSARRPRKSFAGGLVPSLVNQYEEGAKTAERKERLTRSLVSNPLMTGGVHPSASSRNLTAAPQDHDVKFSSQPNLAPDSNGRADAI